MPRYQKLDPNLKSARRKFKNHYDGMVHLIEQHMPNSWAKTSMQHQLGQAYEKFMNNTDPRIKVDAYGFPDARVIRGYPLAESPVNQMVKGMPVLTIVANEGELEDWSGIPFDGPKKDE